MLIPLFHVRYFGEAKIDYWEYVLGIVYVLVLYIYFARVKAVNIKKAPEYKFFLWGLMAKLLGCVVYSLIYFYYYEGGDSVAYFYGAVAMRNLGAIDPWAYLNALFGPNTMENWNIYTFETGKPFQYLYFDDRTFFVIRVTSLFAILTFKSYLVSSLLISSLSFFGIWNCFRTFVSYFPQVTNKLAIAFFFMPSVIFWGSAILKDTFTLSATLWFIHCFDEIIFKKRNISSNLFKMLLCFFIIIFIKPYIFMTLFPVLVAWLLYARISRIRNVLIKFIVVPMSAVGAAAIVLFVLDKLGDSLDKFALDDALQTIEVIQKDLINSDAYGGNSFDVGEFDGTWSGVLAKFPIATNAALFRPYIWESNTIVVMITGLENAWLLGLTLLVLFRVGPGFFLRAAYGNPLIMVSFTFALLFGFVVGVTTPNFGALVRFKVPLIPLYVSAIFLIGYLGALRKASKRNGRRLDLRQFRSGSAHLDQFAGVPGKRHRTSWSKPGRMNGPVRENDR